MGVTDHKLNAPKQVRVFVVTVSDTRTEENDSSGRAAKDMIVAAGHVVAGYRILKDEPAQVVALVKQIVTERLADVVVTSGGTGVSTRDSTYEAVAGLLDKRLDGFGEIFRFFPALDLRAEIAGRDVLDLGSGYGGKTVEYKRACGARTVSGTTCASRSGIPGSSSTFVKYWLSSMMYWDSSNTSTEYGSPSFILNRRRAADSFNTGCSTSIFPNRYRAPVSSASVIVARRFSTSTTISCAVSFASR